MRSSADPGARREAGPRPPSGGGRPGRRRPVGWLLAIVGALAVIGAGGLLLRAIDDREPEPTEAAGPARTSDPASCPELTLEPFPLELRETRRQRLLPDHDVSPLRVDLQGVGEHRLTILSGQAEELSGDPLGQRLVAGSAARLLRTPAGTHALVWTTEDPSCSGYTVVASGYRLDAFEALLGRLVVLPSP